MSRNVRPACGGEVSQRLGDEPARLRAVRLLDIFDTPEERRFDHIADLAKSTLGYPIAAISFIDEDRQWFKSMRGLPIKQTCRSDSVCSLVIENNGAFVVEDASTDPQFRDHPFFKGPNLAAYLGAPIILPDGYAAGSLCVMDHKPRTVTDADLALLKNLAACVVRELELRAEAAIDPMTGLLRRSKFMRKLAEALDMCRAERKAAALAILDIDRFKAVNDSFGHAVGDAVITRVGKTCRSLGGAFPLGRLGGEEFAVALPGRSPEEAFEEMDNLRASVAQTSLAGLPVDSVHVSIGVGVLSDALQDVEAWYRLADAALYEAKDAGRNRVVLKMAPDGSDAPPRSLPRLTVPSSTSPHELAAEAVRGYRTA